MKLITLLFVLTNQVRLCWSVTNDCRSVAVRNSLPPGRVPLVSNVLLASAQERSGLNGFPKAQSKADGSCRVTSCYFIIVPSGHEVPSCDIKRYLPRLDHLYPITLRPASMAAILPSSTTRTLSVSVVTVFPEE